MTSNYRQGPMPYMAGVRSQTEKLFFVEEFNRGDGVTYGPIPRVGLQGLPPEWQSWNPNAIASPSTAYVELVRKAGVATVAAPAGGVGAPQSFAGAVRALTGLPVLAPDVEQELILYARAGFLNFPVPINADSLGLNAYAGVILSNVDLRGNTDGPFLMFGVKAENVNPNEDPPLRYASMRVCMQKWSDSKTIVDSVEYDLGAPCMPWVRVQLESEADECEIDTFDFSLDGESYGRLGFSGDNFKLDGPPLTIGYGASGYFGDTGEPVFGPFTSNAVVDSIRAGVLATADELTAATIKTTGGTPHV